MYICLRRYLLLIAIVFFQAALLQAQQAWVKSLEIPQVFIENQGQYDALEQGFGDQARYVMDHGFGWQVLLGDEGLHYLVQRSLPEREPVADEHEAEREEREILRSHISMEFVGISPSARLEAIERQDDYFTYAYESGDEHVNVNHASAYRQVLYRNIYPGVDATIEGKGGRGIKYSFQVAAGANPQDIRLRWQGAQPQLDSDGNLHMPAVLGELIDQKPEAWYADRPEEKIPVAFRLIGNEVTFQLGAYQSGRAIVIDPWTINPALPAPFNRAFEVDADAAGNVYVFGGGMGYNLKKYNSAGTLQWTHVSPWDTSNAWFGELLTMSTGDCFITSGSAAKIRRLTTAGATTFTNNGPFLNFDEYWHLVLSCDLTKLVAGGSRIIGLTSPQGHIFNLNLTNGNQMAGSPYNVSPVGMKEIRALITGGNGNYYMLSNDNLIALNQTFGTIYSIASGISHPYYSPAYMAQSVQGQNIIDANTSFIYMQNGATLQKRDINTGALVSSVAITGGGFTGGFFGTGATNGGLVIDVCGNVFVGSTNAIYKFDANLTPLGNVATSGAIYDLHIPAAGTLIAGGNALVVSNTSLSPCAPKTIACLILPVELSILQGSCRTGEGVDLNWTTAKEDGMSHFDVERSTDGQTWQQVGRVPASGNSATSQSYAFHLPASPSESGLWYFRLGMIDQNGGSTTSYIATVEACEQGNKARLAPSIASEETELQFTALESGVGRIEIVDNSGKLVMERPITWASGLNALHVQLSGLAPGTYSLALLGANGRQVFSGLRLVKQ